MANNLYFEIYTSPASLFAVLLLSVSLFATLSDAGRRAVRSILPATKAAQTSTSPFFLQHAYNSYVQYENYAQSVIEGKREAFNSLGREGQRLGQEIGYPSTLRTLSQAVEDNTLVTRAIATLAREEHGNIEPLHSVQPDSGLNPDRVYEALRHFFRDWSVEGKEVRDVLFPPILDVMKADTRDPTGLKVFVPGAGLGRLAWEIAKLGFDSTAADYSPFPTLAFRFLLSPKTTTSPLQHVVRPFCHKMDHQKSIDNTVRPIRFPDVVPRHMPNLHLVEMDFLLLPRVPTYDYIVTLFFIDTAFSITDYLTQIYGLLKPGGTWINLGPLLWDSGTSAKMELSLEDVLRVSKAVGFEIVTPPVTVESEYAADAKGMMRSIYQSEFWVAKKLSV